MTDTRTVIDDAGREVAVPATVERLVCIGGGALRQVAYMQATDRIVGVEDGEKEFLTRVPYSMANPELRDLPTIGAMGSNASGNAEQIRAVDPDVIVYHPRGDATPADVLSDRTNTPVVVVDLTFSGTEAERRAMYDTWSLLGDVLNDADRAAELVDITEEYVADLESRSSDRAAPERKRAYVGAINFEDRHGITWTQNPYPPFVLTHTNNVVTEAESAVPFRISVEKLLEWDPPVAFVDASNTALVREDVEQNAALGDVSAIADGEVYQILPTVIYHNIYTHQIANSYYVGKTIYPGDYSEVSMRAKTNEIYERYLGAAVYDEVADRYHVFEPLSIPG